jgi:hypothetical protein
LAHLVELRLHFLPISIQKWGPLSARQSM